MRISSIDMVAASAPPPCSRHSDGQVLPAPRLRTCLKLQLAQEQALRFSHQCRDFLLSGLYERLGLRARRKFL
jgi:hypothetical protein